MADQRIGVEPPSRPLRQVWHTNDVKPKERFAYFREGICQAVFALSPEENLANPLSASIEHVALPQGRLVKFSLSPQSIYRTNEDVRRISDEYVAVYLQISGISALVFDENELLRSAGDLVICDVNKPFSLHIRSGQPLYRFTTFFRKSVLTSVVGSDFRIGNRILSQRPVGPALLTCLSLLESRLRFAPLDELDALHNACAALMLADLFQDREIMTDAFAERGLLPAIKAYIDQNLSNTDLSPKMIANHFQISVRYVHKIFSSQHETIGQYIVSERLKRIEFDLKHPAFMEKSISDIAQRWGFYDTSSFYRNFKAHFQRSPGDVRAENRHGSRLIA